VISRDTYYIAAFLFLLPSIGIHVDARLSERRSLTTEDLLGQGARKCERDCNEKRPRSVHAPRDNADEKLTESGEGKKGGDKDNELHFEG